KVKNINFSKTSRSGFVRRDDTMKPGPGNYNAEKITATKSFKIGQKVNTSIKNKVSGRGTYDLNPNVVMDSVRNVKISNSLSKSVLSSSKSQYIPGPGSYS